MTTAIWTRRFLLAALPLAWSGVALAQTYPAQPISFLVGYNAGGSVDLVAKTIAAPMEKRLHQTITVKSIAGASGAIAAVQVALAPPDGYSLLVGSPAEVGINHLLSRQLRYDPLNDTTPIGLIGSQPMVLVASKKTEVTNVAQFIAYARSHPDTLNFATSGVGTPLHLAGEMINQRAKIKMRHVPLRGATSMLESLADGRVNFAVMVLSSALPSIKKGEIYALGLTQPQRSAAVPDIPALSEDPLFTGIDIKVWFGLLGPAKLPDSITKQLRTALNQSLKEPEVRQKLEAAGLVMSEDVPFEPFLRGEIAKFKQVVDSAQLRK